MPKLLVPPHPSPPPGGYEPCPIDPDWDRFYILDEGGQPVRVYDFGTHARWMSWEGKGYQFKDELPEYGATVWTYFARGVARLRGVDPCIATRRFGRQRGKPINCG